MIPGTANSSHSGYAAAGGCSIGWQPTSLAIPSAAAKDASSSYGIPGSQMRRAILRAGGPSCAVCSSACRRPLVASGLSWPVGLLQRPGCARQALPPSLAASRSAGPFSGRRPSKRKAHGTGRAPWRSGGVPFRRAVVPHEQVLQELSHCMAAVVPSRSESFGLVNIEALSVGTPVVASNVGGIPEIIRAGINGYLVPPGDPVAMQTRLGEFLTDAELRASRPQRPRAISFHVRNRRARQTLCRLARGGTGRSRRSASPDASCLGGGWH